MDPQSTLEEMDRDQQNPCHSRAWTRCQAEALSKPSLALSSNRRPLPHKHRGLDQQDTQEVAF